MDRGDAGFAGAAGVWACTTLAGAVAGDGITVAVDTTGLSGAVGGGGITAAAGGGGATMAACIVLAGAARRGAAAGTAGLPDAVGGGGVTLVASTGPLGDLSVGGVDGSGAFWRRFGISAGFSTGGATWTLAPVSALCAVSWRRRFGWTAA